MAATCSWAPSIGVAGIACSARLYAWILGDLTQDHCYHVKTPVPTARRREKGRFCRPFSQSETRETIRPQRLPVGPPTRQSPTAHYHQPENRI